MQKLLMGKSTTKSLQGLLSAVNLIELLHILNIVIFKDQIFESLSFVDKEFSF